MTLLNGAKTDPSGAVVLRIPCSNADGYVVYLINADGSKTKLNGSVQDGYFVVRTRSLGLIAVGTANSGGNNDNSGNPGIPGNPSSPQTGDNNNGGSGNSGNNDNNNNVSESSQTGVNTTPSMSEMITSKTSQPSIMVPYNQRRPAISAIRPYGFC